MSRGANYQDALAVCPFFSGIQNPKRIACRDEVANGYCVELVFSKKEEAKRYKEKYCESFNYDKCVTYQAMEERIKRREKRKGK